MNPSADQFFFYLLVVWIISYLFISVGQLGAAYFPTADVAQAVLGLIIPLAFLFGGLYLPLPDIPIWRAPASGPAQAPKNGRLG